MEEEGALGQTEFDAALLVVATAAAAAAAGGGGGVPAAVESNAAAAAEQIPGVGVKVAEVELPVVGEPAVVDVAGVERPGHGLLVHRRRRLGADLADAEKQFCSMCVEQVRLVWEDRKIEVL